MIKHEEVRKEVGLCDKEARQKIFDYITEQEKKDELLGLYRECYEEGYFWLEIQQRIKKLEEEMK